MLSENIQKNEAAAKELFPNETWISAETIKIRNKSDEFIIPNDLNNIKIAKSRIPPKNKSPAAVKGEERTLTKEIRQGKILTDMWASVFLLPKLKDHNGNYIPGPDALVNGVLFEFKTITGTLDRVEGHFRNSRKQCENVFLKIDNACLSKSDVTQKIINVMRDPKYTGGTKGDLILYISQTRKTYFMKINELK